MHSINVNHFTKGQFPNTQSNQCRNFKFYVQLYVFLYDYSYAYTGAYEIAYNSAF